MKAEPLTIQSPAKPPSAGLLPPKCDCSSSSLTGECEDCKEKRLVRRKAFSDPLQSISVPPIVSAVLRSPGQPLSNETRSYFQRRLGHDFSRVRVHTGVRAADSANAINANAYTVGQNIVFASGRYAPQTAHGRQLLAHELTHVVQQRSQVANGTSNLSLGDPSDASEREADRVAREVGSTRQPVFVAPQVLQAIGHTCVQRDLALKPTDPGAQANLTPAEIRAALTFNQTELQDTKKLQLVCDLVGIRPPANNEQLVQALALLQAQFKLPLTGKVDQQTWDLLNKELQLEKKEIAKGRHIEQQKNVSKLLEDIRKIPPDTSKGTSDPNTLLLNSVQWIDTKAIKKFTVMTPTHDYDTRRRGEFAYFDWRVQHPNIGGDYDATPPPSGADPGVQYKTDQNVAATAFFDELTFFTSMEPISADDFRRNLVHEVQHVADQVGGRAALSIGVKSDLARTIDSYQAEFRAFWVQPALAAQPGVFVQRYENFGSSQTPATNPGPVYANPIGKCQDFCVTPAGSTNSSQCQKKCDVTNSGPTQFRNEKQQNIFYYLVEKYRDDRFDCFYVCVPEFRKMVHEFSHPTGENLVNSVRIEALIQALEQCKPSMSISNPEIQAVIAAAKNLDPVDRLFLKEVKKAAPPGSKQPPAKDIKSAQPFWDHAGRKLSKAALAMLENAI